MGGSRYTRAVRSSRLWTSGSSRNSSSASARFQVWRNATLDLTAARAWSFALANSKLARPGRLSCCCSAVSETKALNGAACPALRLNRPNSASDAMALTLSRSETEESSCGEMGVSRESRPGLATRKMMLSPDATWSCVASGELRTTSSVEGILTDGCPGASNQKRSSTPRTWTRLARAESSGVLALDGIAIAGTTIPSITPF